MLRKLSSAAIFTPSAGPHRAHGALHKARVLHFGVGKRRELTEQVLDGHLVHLVVARDKQYPQRVVGSFAGKRLHAGVFGGTQKCSKLLDGVHARSLELRKRVGRVGHGCGVAWAASVSAA